MGCRTHSIGKKALALLLTIVPGLGHVLLDRHLAGVLLFTVFAFSANGTFVGARLWVHEDQRFAILLLSTLGLALVYPYAFVRIWRLTFGLDEEARATARGGRMKQAMSHYLRGELDEAAGILRSLLRQDELDVDCLFYLGMIHRDQGEAGKARRTFRRCAALDPKCRWEAGEELRVLRGRPPGNSPGG